MAYSRINNGQMQKVGPIKKTFTMNIASGASVTTEAIDFRPFSAIAIYIPATFTSTTCGVQGAISIDTPEVIASTDNDGLIAAPVATYKDVYDTDEAADWVVTFNKGDWNTITPTQSLGIAPYDFIKITVDSAEAADRVIQVACWS